MTNEISSYLLKLLGFTILIFGIHWYLLSQFFEGSLYFPLWTIYVFNAVLVAVVYILVLNKSQTKPKNVFQLFLILTLVKMALAVVFLIPLFLKKSDHTMLEILNFFIPYFLFLTFEIFSLNKFLQKS